MERAGKVIGKLRLKAVHLAGVKSYHLAPKAWAAAVGKTIAAHSRPVFLDGDRLIVEAEDVIWMSQLRSLEGAILDRIAKIVDAAMIRKLEFRVATQRRGPKTAVSSAVRDESTDIADPVLRRVYVASRRKSTA